MAIPERIRNIIPFLSTEIGLVHSPRNEISRTKKTVTTKVLIKVAILEGTPAVPILAKMATKAAKNAEPKAYICQLLSMFINRVFLQVIELDHFQR